MSELRHALHSIIRNPVFAVSALLTVALGIGANIAVYTIVRSVLLEPLPFREPKALVQVWETHPELHNLQASIPDYFDWKKSLKSLDLTAYTFPAMNKATLLGQGDPVEVQATNASAGLFPLLGIEPLLGRAYDRQEETTKKPFVLIGERLWRRKFSGDPHIIGRTIRLDASSFTVIGVLRQTQAFPVWADVWIPFSGIEAGLESSRQFHPLDVIGRLRPGFSLQQAEIETETVAGRLSSAYPATNGKIGVLVVPLTETITGEVRPALLMVWIAVGLVLLVACVNLGHLMMARSLSRRRDIAVRLALGASRLAAVRELLTETLILSLAGGLLGILVAAGTLPVLRNLAQTRIPRLDALALNVPDLLFGVLLSLFVALLFALPACWQVLHADLNETIRSGEARSASARRSRISPFLMSSEVALALSVLVAATMLVRSFALTLQNDPGFRPGRVLVVNVPLVADWNKSYELFRDRIMPELKRVPGVQDVAAVNAVPMSLGSTEHTRYATRFGIIGRTFDPGRFPTAQIRWCSANFFQVMGIPLKSGRFLAETDHDQPRYVVNEAFARRFFPDGNAANRQLLMDVMTPHPVTGEIVGVVGNVREFGLDAAVEPTIYDLDVSPRMDVLVKTSGSSRPVATSVIATLRRIDPDGAFGQPRALQEYIESSVARQRFALSLMAAFAGMGIVLCMVGIYGVFGYSVTRRLREFGIRCALGAERRDLLALILRECLVVVVPGLFAGVLISLASSRFLRAMLYRVSPTDAFSYSIAAIFILILCLASAIAPAVRAARVDPVRVLKEE